MDAYQILRKMTFSRQLTGTVRKAVRVRLEALLEVEEKSYERWKEIYAHKCTPTQRKIAERNFKKRIVAYKIVIWDLTPIYERSPEVPIFFERK